MGYLEDLIKIAQERGIDVVDVILRELGRVDPEGSIKFRIDLADKLLSEARDYLSKGDAVQASEKAYRAAEEVVKALAEKFRVKEYEYYLREGRWFTHWLASAANELARRLGDWVVNGWSAAYMLHVWGFHEGKLNVNEIDMYIKGVVELVEKAKALT